MKLTKNYCMNLLAVTALSMFVLGALMAMMPSESINAPVDLSEKIYGLRADDEKNTYWDSATLFTDDEKLDGVEIGDADNDGVKDLVICGLSGVVTHIEKNGGVWVSQTLWENPDAGEQITPDIGDIDGDGKNEVVVGGMAQGGEDEDGAGSIDMIEHDGTSWVRTNLFTDINLVHGLTIGDIDPDKPGNEVVGVGFSYNCTLIYNDAGTWKSEVIYTSDGKIKKNIIDDIDPDRAGQEMVIVDKARNVTMIYKDGGVWKSEHMFKAEAGVSRVCVGELDPLSPGKEVVVGDDDGKAYIIRKSGGTWSGLKIIDEVDKNRGVWIGDVDYTHDGNELIVTGYSAEVTMFWGSGSDWSSELIYTVPSKDRVHDVRIGEFDPDHVGNEIVIIGYDQKVTEIMLVTPPVGSFDITHTGASSSYTIGPSETISVPFDLLSIDGFASVVDVTADIPEYLEYSMIPTTGIPPADGYLNITNPAFDISDNRNVTVSVTNGTVVKTFTINLLITADTVAPTVLESYPTEDTDEFDPDEVYAKVVFSEPMVGSTLDIDFDDNKFEYTYYENNNTLMIFNLTDKDGDLLQEGEKFKILVNGEDRGGNALDELEITFETEDEGNPEINWVSVGFLAGLAIVLAIIIVLLYLRGKKEQPDDEEEEEDEEPEEEEKPKKKGGKNKGGSKKGKGKQKTE